MNDQITLSIARVCLKWWNMCKYLNIDLKSRKVNVQAGELKLQNINIHTNCITVYWLKNWSRWLSMTPVALDKSIGCWSLCRCVIIPRKSSAALPTGESAADGALVCYLHCWWDTCGDSISSVPMQRQNIDPRQGLQQSPHQMTHCKCVNKLGLFFFLSERKTKKNETQWYENRNSGTQSKRLAGI